MPPGTDSDEDGQELAGLLPFGVADFGPRDHLVLLVDAGGDHKRRRAREARRLARGHVLQGMFLWNANAELAIVRFFVEWFYSFILEYKGRQLFFPQINFTKTQL